MSSPTPTLPLDPVARPDGDRGRSRVRRRLQTAALLERADDASAAAERDRLLDEVILLNRGVAESVARRFRRRGVDDDDLDQVAYLGLVKAVHGYRTSRSEDLLVYAVPTIRGELQRYFRDHGWSVRPPRSVQEDGQRVRAATDRLQQQLGHEPTDAEVMSEAQIDRIELADVRATRGCYAPTSLDSEVSDGSSGRTHSTLGDLLAGEDGRETAASADERVDLAPALRALGRRDQLLLRLRFIEDLTQAEIGRRLGVSQVQVSRSLSSLLARLRGAVAA